MKEEQILLQLSCVIEGGNGVEDAAQGFPSVCLSTHSITSALSLHNLPSPLPYFTSIFPSLFNFLPLVQETFSKCPEQMQ